MFRDSMGKLTEQPSRQGKGAPLRRTFVTDAATDRPMLVRLMSGLNAGRGGGGRGGRTRLALTLSLLWVVSGGEHTTTRPARFWAELIGLKDPVGEGARMINSSLGELRNRRLIELEAREPGQSNTIRMLNESGSGARYEIPDGKSSAGHYFRIPEALWVTGILHDLTGPGLATYLCALSVYRPADPTMRIWFNATAYRELFGLSETTRKAGFRNLVDNDVLWVSSESIDAAGGRDNRTHRRNIYRFNPNFAPPVPAAASAGGVTGVQSAMSAPV